MAKACFKVIIKALKQQLPYYSTIKLSLDKWSQIDQFFQLWGLFKEALFKKTYTNIYQSTSDPSINITCFHLHHMYIMIWEEEREERRKKKESEKNKRRRGNREFEKNFALHPLTSNNCTHEQFFFLASFAPSHLTWVNSNGRWCQYYKRQPFLTILLSWNKNWPFL